MMQMDLAKMFFAVMFGGDRFEPYIGQLGLSALVDSLTQEIEAMQAQAQAQGAAAHPAKKGGLDFAELKKVLHFCTHVTHLSSFVYFLTSLSIGCVWCRPSSGARCSVRWIWRRGSSLM
jgi:hypothetical protein